MKKMTLIAAAVAMAVSGTAMAASNTFQGRINVGYQHSDTSTSITRSGNTSSRMGFKGSDDLGNGMTGYYSYALNYNVANGDAPKAYWGYVGLKGGFGDVSMGLLTNPRYGMAEGYFDFSKGVPSAGAASKTKNALLYKNKFGGVAIQAMVATDKATTNLSDGTSFGISAPVGPVTLIATTQTDMKGGAVSAGHKTTDLGVVYGMGDITLAAAFITDTTAASVETKTTVIDARLKSGSNTFTIQNVAVKDGNSSTVVGLNHKMSKHVNAYAEVSTGNLFGSQSAFGLNYNF